MGVILKFFLLSLLLSASYAHKVDKKNSFVVLCYHNVTDKIENPNLPSITTEQLISQFKWLKENGYRVISIDDVIEAKEGKKTLPEKSVLLTFDDGYTSFYTRIFPLLKLYGYSAVYALVGKWQDTPMDKSFSYGTIKRKRSMLLTPEQIKEMSDSGIVEFASHSYNAHYGVVANPQNNTRPFYSTLIYDKKRKRYETLQEYKKRVEDDIRRSSDTIYRYTGKRPRIIVWPYGAYNHMIVEIAKKYGMNITASLDDGINTPEDLTVLKRFLIGNNIELNDFLWSLRSQEREVKRALFVDIDQIYDNNSSMIEKRLGILLEKIKVYSPTDVYVKAYSDLDNDGYADTLYFPNSHLPMRADILGRVLWQIKSRTGYTSVHAWMPFDKFEIKNRTVSMQNKLDRKVIEEIYRDLASHTFFHGLLIDNRGGFESDHGFLAESVESLENSIKDFSMRHKIALLLKDNLEKIGASRYDTLLKVFDTVIIDTDSNLNDLNDLRNIYRNLDEPVRERLLIKFDEDDVSTERIARMMSELSYMGALSYGYSSNDYISKEPSLEILRYFSTNYDPFK